MEGNPDSSTLVPATMFLACKRRFVGNTSGESINGDDQPHNGMGFSRKAIHDSLDLNQPISDLTLIRLDGPSQLPPPREERAVPKTGLGQLLEDTNKRGFAELEENEKFEGLDLALRLSTQVEDQADQVSPQLGSSSGISLDPKTKKVRADGGELKEHSLIAMECTPCRIFVMASKIDPTCPNCGGCVLLDQSRGDLAESMRKM